MQLGTNIKRTISSDDFADSKRYQLLETIQILKLSTFLQNPSLALQSNPVRSMKLQLLLVPHSLGKACLFIYL